VNFSLTWWPAGVWNDPLSLVRLEVPRETILAACPALPPRRLALAEALGRVTAASVTAGENVPPFDNTAMDGYALRAVDTIGAPVLLQVIGTLAAGSAATQRVEAGQAVRIMTGAPIPAGADAVVMVERTRPGDEATVWVEEAVGAGNHIRPAGDDIAIGQIVFEKGTTLSPGHLGALASVGSVDVEVFPPARVGVLSTGDELVDGGRPLAPGQIRDTNRLMLLGLLAQAGCETVDLGQGGDNEQTLEKTVASAAAACDALITTGGVSVGDFDFMKAILARLGTMHSWQVAIKPAKPLAFGVVSGTPVFGLPGNPVSALVSFELFARPALRRMMGHAGIDRPRIEAVADEDLRRAPDGKIHFMRVNARWGDGGRLHVASSGGQGSHMLRAMALANALAVLPDGGGVKAGEGVETMVLGNLQG